MREPGAAVILDTETTDLDGCVVEVAVVDAATGATLLDTLVNPGCPIEPGGHAVHGISDADVAGAPAVGRRAAPAARGDPRPHRAGLQRRVRLRRYRPSTLAATGSTLATWRKMAGGPA